MKKKYIYIIILGIVLCIIFFFLGRATIKGGEVIKTVYIKGDTVRETCYVSKPYRVIEPVDTSNIIAEAKASGKFDNYIIEEVDTMLILKDWATKRQYSFILFDNDTTGTCKVDVDLQYNEIQNLNYEYTPIYKEIITTKKEPLFEPFVSGGISYPLAFYIGGGTFIKKHHGIEVSIDTKKEVKLGYIYKF